MTLTFSGKVKGDSMSGSVSFNDSASDDWSAKWNCHETMMPEFEKLKKSTGSQATHGPGGTLIFLDGDQYCVVAGIVSTEISDCYAFGEPKKRRLGIMV